MAKKITYFIIFSCMLAVCVSGCRGQKGSSATEKIFTAISQGNLIAVKQLLAKGIDANIRDVDGVTPLNRAAFCGQTEIVALLISKGANVNAQDNSGFTPLIWTAEEGKKETAELLITKGADVNLVDNNKTAPLHYAAASGDPELVRLLLAKGANVNARDALYNSTPLEAAEETNHTEAAAVIRLYGGAK